MEPYLWNFKVRRDQARKAIAVATDSYQETLYQILEALSMTRMVINAAFGQTKDFSKILSTKKNLTLRTDQMEPATGPSSSKKLSESRTHQYRFQWLTFWMINIERSLSF